MKIVLLNPNNPESRNDAMISDFVGSVPPYGLAQIASVVRQGGNDVRIIDQYIEHRSEKDLIKTLSGLKPDVIGISVLAPVFGWVKRLCVILRRILPDAKIVFGNSYASIFYEQILEDGLADVVVHSEGEYTFAAYIDTIASKKDIRNVAGISFRDKGVVIKNPPRPLIADLDQLPYPAWDCIALNKYNRVPILSLHEPALLIQGSRGCNYNCFYCSQDSDFKEFRKRKMVSIADEIEYLYKKYHLENFIFLDAYFPFSIDSGFEFCDELIKRGLHKKIKWITETKVDLVNYRLLKKMREAGLYLIMYGFETGNERILKLINKHTTLEKAHQVMKDTKDLGIRTLGLFMLGFPDETEREARETIRFSKSLGCDLVKYNLLTPYPGTGLYDKYIPDKLFAYKNSELFSSWYMISNKNTASFNFSKMSTENLLNIQRLALVSYYVRPCIIYNTIAKHIVKFNVIFKAIPFLLLNLVFLVKKYISNKIYSKSMLFYKMTEGIK